MRLARHYRKHEYSQKYERYHRGRHEISIALRGHEESNNDSYQRLSFPILMFYHPLVEGDRTPPKRRTTVAQAAEILGISAEAVRGRIRRGTLLVERQGGTVYVLLDPPTDNRTTDDQTVTL